MMRNRILLGFVVFAFFLSGCTSLLEPEPSEQYLCPDGVTIVTDLEDCPKIDVELKECEDASSRVFDGVSDRDVCYYELALDRENITLCKKIRNIDSWYGYTAAECGAEIAMIEGNPKLCDELSFLSEYDCYLELATQLGDAAICAEIASTSKRDDCYLDMAYNFDDPEVCMEISSSSDKDDCLYDYVSWNAYYVDDWSICDEFSSGSWEQSYCYYEAAGNTGLLTYCDKITSTDRYSSYTKPVCYAVVAKQRKNPSLCETFTDSYDKDDCYYEYATLYPYDVNACEKITSSYRKSDCVYYANDTYYY